MSTSSPKSQKNDDMEVVLIVNEFLVLYSLFGCADYVNDALNIVQEKLKQAIGKLLQTSVFDDSHTRGRNALLSVLFNKNHDNDKALIDNLANYYYAGREWRLEDAKAIKKLKALNICTPFTPTELEIIKKENEKMCKTCEDWERRLNC
jgi:predicted esterase YcpF (UPF0227 family)